VPKKKREAKLILIILNILWKTKNSNAKTMPKTIE
jgi:hypothetical protein